MDILFLLVPLSVMLAFMVIGIFAWALAAGQFDEEVEAEGELILNDESQQTTTKVAATASA